MGRLVDFHTHLFSRTFFESLARASSLPGTPEERLERVARDAELEVPSAAVPEHVARWIAELDAHGVVHAVTFASVPEEAPVVAEAVRGGGGRLTGMAVLDPRGPDAAGRCAKLLDELGMRGVVLFPALHGYRIDGAEARAVLAVLDERAAFAIVHCGLLSIPLRDRFGLPRPADLALANPLHLVAAADAHPRARFVVPHLGAGLFRETLMAGRACANVLVDTSSSNTWLRTQPVRITLADALERALDVFGPRRILFGTDSSVFPRGWRHDVLVAQREALGSLGLGDADRARVFGENAAELLELGE